MGFITVNNLTLHVKRDGVNDAPPLVFINSLGTDLRMWDAMIPALAADYALIRYDKPGHGLSDCPPASYTLHNHAEDVAGLLDTLQISKAIVVGISIGGMIAMDFAATQPERVAALALCDTFPKIGVADMWNERIATLRQHGMAHLGGAILARWFAPGFASQQPAAYNGYLNMLARMPVEGYTAACTAIRDADLTEAVSSIGVPTLVLCGAEDPSTPPELVRGLVGMLPNAQYSEIDGAGHLPPIEQPTATVSAIRAFLEALN
jgi:3-oxoadipate enol-lactonase